MKLYYIKKLIIFVFYLSESFVVVGDIIGRILVWRGFGNRIFLGNEQVKVILIKYEDERFGVRGDDDVDFCLIWYWYLSEVKFLLFFFDGVYLYLGG